MNYLLLFTYYYWYKCICFAFRDKHYPWKIYRVSDNNELIRIASRDKPYVDVIEDTNFVQCTKTSESEQKEKNKKKKRKANRDSSLDHEIKPDNNSVLGNVHRDGVDISVKKGKKKRKGDIEFGVDKTANHEVSAFSVYHMATDMSKKKKKLNRRKVGNGKFSEENSAKAKNVASKSGEVNIKKNKSKDNKIQQRITTEDVGFVNKEACAGNEEMQKKKRNKKKSKDEDSAKVFQEVQHNEEIPRRGMELRKKRKLNAVEQTNCGIDSSNKEGKSHKKRKLNVKKAENDKVYNLSDERLKSYGLNPKKFKNKLKYKKQK